LNNLHQNEEDYSMTSSLGFRGILYLAKIGWVTCGKE